MATSLGMGYALLDRPTGLTGPRHVRVEPGMTARQIGQRLKAEGLIRSVRLFAWSARLAGLAHRLEAGTYELDGRASTQAVLRRLLEAPLELTRVTVPEGLTRLETAGLLQRCGVADSARFAAVSERLDLVRELGLTGNSLEGFLYPETYFLDHGATEEEIARRMVGEFFTVFNDSLFGRLDSLGMSLREAVTLASIVELEARAAAERPIIAAIFHRRLNLGRRLESCATVEYALGVHRERLTNADLRVASPYNTYLHGGLPPGPIGSPGRASILATLYPGESDYLYFVARGDGTHQFSRTNREHEAAKGEVRRQQRRRAQEHPR
ncbi:MAG: endolytic transglycosylase MltG [Gemmatimonadota bacterium]